MSLYHVISLGSTSLLHINNIGCSSDPENNRFGPGRRDIWLIHYVTKGKGYFNGKLVRAGQGFLIYRGQEEAYYPDKNDPWEFLWITLDDDNAKPFFEQYETIKGTQIFDYDFVFIIKNIMNYIKANHQKILKDEEMLEIFLHIFNNHKKPDVKLHSGNMYFKFSVNYIKTHLHSDPKVGDIARILGISQTHLLNIFKKETGLSPKQYISNIRMLTAKKMLTSTDMSISGIASTVGFKDVLAFSRFFSSKEKVSPTSYRNLHSL